jgi:hypothetical protein
MTIHILFEVFLFLLFKILLSINLYLINPYSTTINHLILKSYFLTLNTIKTCLPIVFLFIIHIVQFTLIVAGILYSIIPNHFLHQIMIIPIMQLSFIVHFFYVLEEYPLIKVPISFS